MECQWSAYGSPLDRQWHVDGTLENSYGIAP